MNLSFFITMLIETIVIFDEKRFVSIFSAVFDAIEGVHEKPDDQPYDESDPRRWRQLHHQVKIDEHTQEWH